MEFRRVLDVCVLAHIQCGIESDYVMILSLLGIDGNKVKDVDAILLDKNEIFRPGYTRISMFSDS